jgi:hypothetical protein
MACSLRVIYQSVITTLVYYTKETRHFVITPLVSYTNGTRHLVITLLISYTKGGVITK